MKTMEMFNNALILLVIILVILLVVQWVVIVKQKKEKDNLAEWLNDCADKLAEANKELDEYKIRETSQIPLMPNNGTLRLEVVDYLFIEEEVKRLRGPYKVGQKVIYNDEGFAKVGYIHSIRSVHNILRDVGTDKKEITINYTYEIRDMSYRDVVKEYKLKFSTQVDIDAEEQGLSFGDIATNFVLDDIKEREKPFIDKIVELGYTLEQLKSGELNDVFIMHVREYKVKGELWRQHCLRYKDEEVICKAYKA